MQSVPYLAPLVFVGCFCLGNRRGLWGQVKGVHGMGRLGLGGMT